jgi:hypothetical protein
MGIRIRLITLMLIQIRVQILASKKAQTRKSATIGSYSIWLDICNADQDPNFDADPDLFFDADTDPDADPRLPK